MDTQAPAAAAATISKKPDVLQLEDILPGFSDQEDKYRIAVSPRDGSSKDASAIAVFDPPSGNTVTEYDNITLGLKGKRANPSKAVDFIISTKFIDFEGLEMPEAIRAAHGTWKSFLLNNRKARPLADSIAGQYVIRCRPKSEAEES